MTSSLPEKYVCQECDKEHDELPSVCDCGGNLFTPYFIFKIVTKRDAEIAKYADDVLRQMMRRHNIDHREVHLHKEITNGGA